MTSSLELCLPMGKHVLNFLFINSNFIEREFLIKTVLFELGHEKLGKRCVYRFVTLGHVSLRASSIESVAVAGVDVGGSRLCIIICSLDSKK